MAEFNDESLMPFGKHKGEKMANVPAPYLLWLKENANLHDNLKNYIESNLDLLKAEAAKSNKKKK